MDPEEIEGVVSQVNPKTMTKGGAVSMDGQKLKIALMSSQTIWGGGEQFIWSLGRGLMERGHQIVWFTDPTSPLAAKIQTAGCRQFSVPSRKPKIRDLLRIRRICESSGVQVMHANDTHAVNWSSIALLGKKRIRRVAVKHTAFPIQSAARYNWLVDSLVCVSQAVRKICIESGIAESRTTVIHGGVENASIQRTEARFSICEQLGIDKSVPVFSAVGSLLPCKAYHRLVEAAHHLRWHLPEFRVAICGEGRERGSLEKLIRKYSLEKHVQLLGFQADPSRWIAGSDAFVHPSLSEGLSLVAIQAQMLGVPVIASECDGLAEVLRNPYTNKELGWILRGDDPSMLANLMLDALHQNERRFERLQAAKNSALDRFHVQRMIGGFERLYTRLVGQDVAVSLRSGAASQESTESRERESHSHGGVRQAA